MDEIIVYEPDNSLKKGYFSIFRDIVIEIIQNRWLIFQLFKRDFSAIYRQSIIGFLWAFIVPLCSILTFVLLNQAGILSIGEISVPYPVFAVFGMAFWQLFSTGLISSSNAVISAGTMIAKINFSKKSLVIASTGQSFISFLVQVALGCVLLAYFHVMPSAGILLIPLLTIPIILLMLGFGFILSIINAIARDVGNIISLFLTFLMFITPILYARPDNGLLAVVNTFNPLYYLISGARDMILMGTIPYLTGYVLSVVFALAIFTISLISFHLTETKVTERL